MSFNHIDKIVHRRHQDLNDLELQVVNLLCEDETMTQILLFANSQKDFDNPDIDLHIDFQFSNVLRVQRSILIDNETLVNKIVQFVVKRIKHLLH
jgi:CRISPR/Cas system Type II protein with McrA/HNH and RuvC-like nuclease domain